MAWQLHLDVYKGNGGNCGLETDKEGQEETQV